MPGAGGGLDRGLSASEGPGTRHRLRKVAGVVTVMLEAIFLGYDGREKNAGVNGVLR